MIEEMRRDLYVVYVIYGLFGIGCQVQTRTGDVVAESRGEEDEDDAVRVAYHRWKERKKR